MIVCLTVHIWIQVQIEMCETFIFYVEIPKFPGFCFILSFVLIIAESSGSKSQ